MRNARKMQKISFLLKKTNILQKTICIFPEMDYINCHIKHGVLAQLARAPHWQCGGQGFEFLILHHDFPSSSLSCFFCALKAQKLLCRENHVLHSLGDGGRPRKENRKDQQICFTPTLSAASTILINDISKVPVIYANG